MAPRSDRTAAPLQFGRGSALAPLLARWRSLRCSLAVASYYLDRAERHLRVGGTGPALSRSHTADLRTVGWYGPPLADHHLAIDAEASDGAVPPALAARFGTVDFWARWTRAESLCKAYGVPIAVWLRRYGLGVPQHLPAVWRTLTIDDLTVSVACVPAGATEQGAG